MCGEKLMVIYTAPRAGGSPPRVRGKVVTLEVVVWVTRITPACAGKSLQQGGRSNIFWDHPRVCGEKTGLSSRISPCGGSPPRVRGKGAMPDGIAGHHRITPACAGKREKGLWRFCEYKDHPRVCGEKDCHATSSFFTEGSPPRVRGKVYSKGVGQIYSGITPACAGKRPACPAESALVEDHPRVCGEKARCRMVSRDITGSPPRVRGKEKKGFGGFVNTRITPACAGKRIAMLLPPSLLKDHPRVCGEKSTEQKVRILP